MVHVWQLELYIDGLVQDCSISSTLAMEILQSCAKPSIWRITPDRKPLNGSCVTKYIPTHPTRLRDHFVNAPCQSETTLHCNAVSHWLGAFTKWSLQPRLLHSSSHGGNRTVSGVYMRHGLQLAGITRWWLVGLNIYWDCLVSHCIIGSHDQWEFPPFFRPQWESLHNPNGKQMPAVLAVQGDYERVYAQPWATYGDHTIEKPFITLQRFCVESDHLYAQCGTK